MSDLLTTFPDGEARGYEAAEGDRSRMYVLDVLGISVLVHQRPDGRMYVHVETTGTTSEPAAGSAGKAVAVEVNNGGENLYGEDCLHSWQAGMLWVAPEDAAEVDRERRAAGEEPVTCSKCEATLPVTYRVQIHHGNYRAEYTGDTIYTLLESSNGNNYLPLLDVADPELRRRNETWVAKILDALSKGDSPFCDYGWCTFTVEVNPAPRED